MDAISRCGIWRCETRFAQCSARSSSVSSSLSPRSRALLAACMSQGWVPLSGLFLKCAIALLLTIRAMEPKICGFEECDDVFPQGCVVTAFASENHVTRQPFNHVVYSIGEAPVPVV